MRRSSLTQALAPATLRGVVRLDDRPSEPFAPGEETAKVGIVLTTDPGGSRIALDAFCKALGAATGIDVRGVGVWSYRALLESMEAGQVDFAWLPPLLALRATGSARVVPIALPVRHGASSYLTALFTRNDAPYRAIEDLVELRAAWVDRQSAAGYIVLRAHLRALGVDLDQAFRENIFCGNHDEVVRAVLEGDADVGATFMHVEADPDKLHGEQLGRAGWGTAAVHVITRAGPIPSDLMAASVRVPVATTRAVQRALVSSEGTALSAAAQALFGAESFIEVLDEHLAPLAKLLSGMEEPLPGRESSMLPPEL